MKISSLISGKSVATISGGANLYDLVCSLRDHQVGALVVSDDGRKVQGIVSERDVVRILPNRFEELKEVRVRDIMTESVTTCTIDTSVEELMKLMTELRIRHVPVVDSTNELISIVSIGDIVKARISEIDTERESLQNYINS